MTEALIIKRGWHLHTVASGEEAQTAVADRRYDLILLAVRLPGRDGFEVAKEIRSFQSGNNTRTPILGLTSRSEREEEQKCLRAGMDGVLCKPIRAEEFYGKTERLCFSEHADEPHIERVEPDIDFEAISGLLDGDQELMSEVLHEFRRECPSKIDALRAAVGERRSEEADRASQRLRGPLLYFHCKAAANDLNTLSNLALSGRWPEADKRLQLIESSVAAICVEIEGRLGMLTCRS